jgi:D-glycero-D-manno-heptose 1,7-bisphosphate phosphatase
MNKALFLDRDGVINKEIHHLHRIADCAFCNNIFELTLDYQNRGYLIIVITNQAGIAKGLYTSEAYFKLRDWIHAQFELNRVHITAEYFCPHHPDYTGECECRKPKPGMLLQAQYDWDIDMAQSILIGDKNSDIEAGRRAGIEQLVALQGRYELIQVADVTIIHSLEDEKLV